jgi:hypothetical protein
VGNLKELLFHVADKDEWIQRALDALLRQGLTEAAVRTTLSKETVVATYSVRKMASADANPTMSKSISEMLEHLESMNLESVMLHAIPHEQSNHEILLFTDLAMRWVIGVVAVPRQTR